MTESEKAIKNATRRVNEVIIRACLPQPSTWFHKGQEEFEYKYPTRDEGILADLNRAKTYAPTYYAAFSDAEKYSQSAWISVFVLVKSTASIALALQLGLPLTLAFSACAASASAVSLTYFCYKSYSSSAIAHEKWQDFQMARTKHIAEVAGLSEENKDITKPLELKDKEGKIHHLDREVVGYYPRCTVKIPLFYIKKVLKCAFPQPHIIVME